MTLKAIALNCTLKASEGKETSSTDRMIGLLADALKEKGVDVRRDDPDRRS